MSSGQLSSLRPGPAARQHGDLAQTEAAFRALWWSPQRAGLSNPQICQTLHLSPGTVKTHVNRIFSKLQLRDRVHAVILAHELRAQ